MVSKPLTLQQKAFVSELLASPGFNVTDAARRAGYAKPNVAGFKLLKIEGVQKAIAEAQKERENRSTLKADNVLNYLQAALFQNPLQLFKPGANGTWIVKSLAEIPPGMGALIDHISIKKNGEVSIKLVSKSNALEMAMKHLGFFAPEKHNHEVRHHIDWDEMHRWEKEPDLIEVEISKVEAESLA